MADDGFKLSELDALADGVLSPPARIGTVGPTDEQVLEWFVPKVVPADRLPDLGRIRAAYQDAAKVVLDLVPASADRSAALRELANASRSAVQAYTHNQED